MTETIIELAKCTCTSFVLQYQGCSCGVKEKKIALRAEVLDELLGRLREAESFFINSCYRFGEDEEEDEALSELERDIVRYREILE